MKGNRLSGELSVDLHRAALGRASGAPRLSPDDLAALGRAAEQLDAAWDFDAARGLRDQRGGPAYQRESPAPRLRALAQRFGESAV
jgi:hypothetical protein